MSRVIQERNKEALEWLLDHGAKFDGNAILYTSIIASRDMLDMLIEKMNLGCESLQYSSDFFDSKTLAENSVCHMSTYKTDVKDVISFIRYLCEDLGVLSMDKADEILSDDLIAPVVEEVALAGEGFGGGAGAAAGGTSGDL